MDLGKAFVVRSVKLRAEMCEGQARAGTGHTGTEVQLD